MEFINNLSPSTLLILGHILSSCALNLPSSSHHPHQSNFVITPPTNHLRNKWDNLRSSQLASSHHTFLPQNPPINYSHPYFIPSQSNSSTWPQPHPLPNDLLLSHRQESGHSSNPYPPKPENSLPRRPGLPNDPPGLPPINLANVAALLALAQNESSSPHNLTLEQQLLVLQTLSEISNFVGLHDMRDWLGIISMFFVAGPVLIPMFWFPILLIILGSFMIPLAINGAGIAAAVAVAEGGAGVIGRSQDQGPGMRPLESYCLELWSCEVHNFLRTSPWSGWISRAFKLTSVEWAGRGQGEGYYSAEEDCRKYKCPLVTPLQNFLSSWYSYLFSFQQVRGDKEEYNSGDSIPAEVGVAVASAKKRRRKVKP